MAQRPDRTSETPGAWSRGARRLCVLASLPILVASQGCYTYHVTQLPELRPGEEVRVEIAGDDRRSVVPTTALTTGPRRFEGRFARLSEDSVIVSVWIGGAYVGTPFETTYQDVALPRIEVSRVENRQLDMVRTLLMAGGTAVVIGYLIDSIGAFDIFQRRGGELPPDPPEGFRKR